jgi:hypothetical protein
MSIVVRSARTHSGVEIVGAGIMSCAADTRLGNDHRGFGVRDIIVEVRLLARIESLNEACYGDDVEYMDRVAVYKHEVFVVVR